MPAARQVPLSAQQVAELQDARDHAPQAYVRVKAAAILKVSQGLAVRQVAAHHLLKPVAEATVSGWITRYQHNGLASLLVQAGRGRKPAFFP